MTQFWDMERAGIAHDELCVLCCAGSPGKTTYIPAVQICSRKHKHRRNQTLAYHRRIQKKWDKRAERSVITLRLPAKVAAQIQELVNVV